MGIIKTEYKYTQLNITGNEIIDRETGEAFDISNAVILKKTETGKISIHYASFIYLNIEKLRGLLEKKIKQIDLALLVSMSCNLEEKVNISLKDDDTPHTAASIGKLVRLSEQSTKLKLNSLLKKDLLHYGVLRKKTDLGKVYVVNPHLIKTKKSFDSFIGVLFNDIE